MKPKNGSEQDSPLHSVTQHIGKLAVGFQQQLTSLLAPEKASILSIFDQYDIVQKSDKHLQFLPTRHKTWLGAYIFQAYIEGGLTSKTVTAAIHHLNPADQQSHDAFMLALYAELGDSLMDYIHEYREAKHNTRGEE